MRRRLKKETAAATTLRLYPRLSAHPRQPRRNQRPYRLGTVLLLLDKLGHLVLEFGQLQLGLLLCGREAVDAGANLRNLLVKDGNFLLLLEETKQEPTAIHHAG